MLFLHVQNFYKTSKSYIKSFSSTFYIRMLRHYFNPRENSSFFCKSTRLCSIMLEYSINIQVICWRRIITARTYFLWSRETISLVIRTLQSLKSDRIPAIHLVAVSLFQESSRDTRQVRRLFSLHFGGWQAFCALHNITLHKSASVIIWIMHTLTS